MHILLLLLLSLASIGDAQTRLEPSTINAATQQPLSALKTYRDTIRMLKEWRDSQENDALARLFAVADTRAADLLAACQTADDETAGAAFMILQLHGQSACGSCTDSMSERHSGLAFSCATNLADADFERIEQWWAGRHTSNGYQCGDEDESRIDDALVYALILDGSTRSQSALSRMLALERYCEGPNALGVRILEQAHSLIASAREIGHDLKLEPSLEQSIRASAFFLPPAYRKKSKVDVLSRTDDRILLEVSYLCGPLCGRSYYVVLRKDGLVWQYALIRMAWIS